jgi:hypothetical protein
VGIQHNKTHINLVWIPAYAGMSGRRRTLAAEFVIHAGAHDPHRVQRLQAAEDSRTMPCQRTASMIPNTEKWESKLTWPPPMNPFVDS